MTEVVVSVTRPEICVIRHLNEHPCHVNEQPCDQQFLLDHRMNVNIAIRDVESGSVKPIVDLNCMYVNMDSKKDIVSCKDTDFQEVIERVEKVNMPVDNLIIVHSAIVTRKATLEEMTQAFEKIQCVLCRAASVTFKIGYDPGIYFDYKFMQPKAAKLIDASLREYTDGDMRKEKYEDGCYIHKIPWRPENRNNNISENR